MRPAGDGGGNRALRVVLVGTGTGVGKTHVACSLLACWAERGSKVVGLKPVETGIATVRGGSHGAQAGSSDQERLTRAARMFHVKPVGSRERQSRVDGVYARRGARGGDSGPTGSPELAGQGTRQQALAFHVKRTASRAGRTHPRESLFAFPEPVSPHLAARDSGRRIDLGAIDRWIRAYEAPITVVETAGGLFSPLGHGSTNFELTQALRPHAVILVALDRLGVLHELTTTLALAAARGNAAFSVVLSTPAPVDASTGRNAGELAALGIARPIAVFPRAKECAPASFDAARQVIAWIEGQAGRR